VKVLDLGHQPHSDDFLSPERLNEVEFFYPLKLVSCEDCGLLQIDYFVNPEILYQTNYVYMTSANNIGVKHFHAMAESISSRFEFPRNSLAVDIGSNDGTLLQGFRKVGFDILGVDPATDVCRIASDNGVPVIVDFFGNAVAERISKENGKAKVITGTNVFAHMHELDSATAGMVHLLDEDGVLVIEAPFAKDMIEKLEYDTIYHQHIGYISVKPLQSYLARFGLEIFDVEPQEIHGGVLRYFVGHHGKRPVMPSVSSYIAEEEEFGLYDKESLKNFQARVERQRRDLLDLVRRLRDEGKSIAIVSAPAKGNTLLNYCNIDTSLVEFATEHNLLKVGKYTPGTHIPIFSDSELLVRRPDYAIILAWNFADQIMEKLSEYREGGGQFIIPIPDPKIVN